MVSLIAAMAKNRVIGMDNRLPWRLPADLKRFKELTMGHPIIMGRKTFESIGKPLPGRSNIVVSRGPAPEDAQDRGIFWVGSLEKAFLIAQNFEGADEVFVIGGANVYAQALPIASKIYLTVIDQEIPGDALFPKFEQQTDFALSEELGPFEKKEDPTFRFSFLTYTR